jgi:hypothetical protein
MDTAGLIVTGHSVAADASAAAAELATKLALTDAGLVIFFCSPSYDRDELSGELAGRFGDAQLVGCTTAGELGPAGFKDRGISGVGFSSRCCAAASGWVGPLDRFEREQAEGLVQGLLQRLEAIDSSADSSNTFALLLIDGLSIREEAVAQALQGALGGIPLIGGSAGDDLDFRSTWVYCDGAFRADSAVVALISTPLPFTTFKTQHLVMAERRVVVTDADPSRRIVREIDGLPAAEEYARLVGVEPGSLDPDRFATQPVVVVINGTEYVRSIQKRNADGSLTFFCAIDEGLVLRAARSGSLVEDLERALADVRSQVGQPLVVIAFDCVLRKLEIVRRGCVGEVEALLRANSVVGFHTYGEQYRGVHVNQTLAGIAIGGGVSA